MIARRLNGQGKATAGRDLFGRASAFLDRALELTADSVRQVEGGWAIVTPSLPQVWSLNQIRLIQPVTPDTTLELADEHLASVPYRHLAADNELGRVLEQPLRSKAFAVEHEVVMAIVDGPNKAAPRSPAPRIIEVSEQRCCPWSDAGSRRTSA